MNKQNISASAPGKLYIAGEYGVVSGSPAILVAVDQYLTISLTPAETGSIHSSLHPDLTLTYTGHAQNLTAVGDNLYPHITASLSVFEQYLGGATTNFTLEVASQLDAASGIKYGLGSSGAVTVATIKALLTYYQQPLEPLIIYKLAVLAHRKLASNGSFGDLAASTYGGWLAYRKFDADWLDQAQAQLSTKALVETVWPGLEITPLTLPEPLSLIVGWTQSAASTTDLVNHMQNQGSQKEKSAYQTQFVKASQVCVEKMILGFQMGNVETIQAGLIHNRKLLQEFGQVMGLPIETPALKTLCDIATIQGAVAKSSGAGGGDCGICLVISDKQAQTIKESWQKRGIEPLDVKVAHRLGGDHAG